MDLDNIFSKIPESKAKAPNQKNKNKQSVQIVPSINFTQEQQLKQELNRLELCKLTSEQLYNKLPNSFAMMNHDNDKSKYVITNMMGDDALYNDKIESKAFLIGKFENPFKIKNQADQTIQQPIKTNFNRQLKVFKTQLKDLTYESVKPMNTIWNLYIQDMLSKETIKENIYAKLLKADLHGALIQVCYAKCKQLEGLEGIVVQERLKSFLIVTENNRLKTIFKENAIFILSANGRQYKIYGCQIVYRASDRIKIRFKYHTANQFVYSSL